MYAIAAMSFGSALVIIDGGVANVALPTIARDLAVGQSAVVSVVTVYQVMLVMLLLPFAGLGERIGLRNAYQAGQAIFTIATILCFFAKSLPFLLIVRAAQAIGAAGVLSVSSALIRQIYPSNQLGRGLGINSVVVTSSAAIAPTIGGLILSIAPWPWVFASAVPFALISLALGSAIPNPARAPCHVRRVRSGALRRDVRPRHRRTGEHGAWRQPGRLRRHRHRRHTRRHLFRPARTRRAQSDPADRSAGAPSAGPVRHRRRFVAFTASMTLLISTPFRLHALGFSTAAIGATIAPWPLTNMIVAPAAGFLSDRVPAGILGGIGMSVSIVALLLLAFMPADPSLFDVAWRMALCGSGFGLYLPPNARLLGRLGPARAGRCSRRACLHRPSRRTDHRRDAGRRAARAGHRRGPHPADGVGQPRGNRRPVQRRASAAVDPQPAPGGSGERPT